MLDIKYIRENAGLVKKAIIAKKIDLDLDELLKTDEHRRALMVQVDELRKQRNEIARARDVIRGKEIKSRLEDLETKLAEIDKQHAELMVRVPTVPAADTPEGKDDTENIEIEKWGEIRQFDFAPKDHIQIGKEKDLLDFERGAKVGGYRGYYLKNKGAVLQMALMMYALHKMIQKGYSPMIPPTLINEFALFGSGYFKSLNFNPDIDEIYQIATRAKDASGKLDRDRKFLVGTAEPSLLAYYAGEVLDLAQLPIKLCGLSQCYRSEIGSYGKDTKGLYRVHEFMKVEQVVISPADIDLSDKLQMEMIEISKEIHQDLGLPFRVLRICAGDLGAGKYKQYDLEAWMPGLNRYGETGSSSNFLDWQSRRLNVRYRDQNGLTKHVYMLNNTALPTPRPIIAILENFQQKDGTIVIPEVLRKYTGFETI